MNFISDEHLNMFLSNLIYLGEGAQGTCYLNKSTNKVFKIFRFFDEEDYQVEYTENEILRFKDVKNNTFLWANGVIKIKDKIVGYVSDYVNAKNLYKTNPLAINIDKLSKAIIESKKDIKIISNAGIITYDIPYNTLYNNKLYVIDHDEYSYSDKENSELEKINNNNFDYEIYMFLIDGYFNSIVNNNKILYELYKNKKENVLIFIKEFKKYLSELVGKDVRYLKEANKYIDTVKNNKKYERLLIKRY